MGQITGNAMAWVQFRLAGGFRSTSIMALAYALVVIAIMSMIVLLNDGRRNTLDGAPSILLGVQAFILCGVMAFRIANAIQRDTTSKLMESHRLMPVDPRLAILGYAAGAGLSALPIVIVNFILGGIAVGNANLPLAWWISANVVLLSFCVFAWCVAAGGSIAHPIAGVLLYMPLLVAFITGGAAAYVLPGLAVLVSPIAGKSIFEAQTVGSEHLMMWLTCLLFQAAIGVVVVLAGARRFRSSEIPAFTGLLGSVLVLLFAAASIVAVCYPGLLPKRMDREWLPQCIGTVITLIALSIVTVFSHVGRHMTELAGQYRGLGLYWRDAAVVLTPVAATVMFALAAPQESDKARHIALTASEVVICMVAALCWARWHARRGASAGLAMVAIGLWWVLPLMTGSILAGHAPADRDPLAMTILQISPPSMLYSIWAPHGQVSLLQLAPALIVQLAVPAIAALLLLLNKHQSAAGSPALSREAARL